MLLLPGPTARASCASLLTFNVLYVPTNRCVALRVFYPRRESAAISASCVVNSLLVLTNSICKGCQASVDLSHLSRCPIHTLRFFFCPFLEEEQYQGIASAICGDSGLLGEVHLQRQPFTSVYLVVAYHDTSLRYAGQCNGFHIQPSRHRCAEPAAFRPDRTDVSG